MAELLNIRNLHIWFNVRTGFIAGLFGKEAKHVRAVDGISFDVKRGEVFCLVGESGCGKTTTGKALIRLNEPTDGNVFFDVPEQDWERFTAMEQRLKELESTLAGSADGGAGVTGRPARANAVPRSARSQWKQVRRLTRRIESLRNPRGALSGKARREHLETTLAFLRDREEDISKGADPALKRILGKHRLRLDLMEKHGPWFTPRRARKLEKIEKELKEAKYQAFRATTLQEKERKTARRVRRLERRVEKVMSHETKGDPETAAQIQAEREALAERTKSVTDLELSRVQSERASVEERLQGMPVISSDTEATEIRELESRIAQIRLSGGPALEALELRARINLFRGHFDLARWGARRRLDVGPRKGRRARNRARKREFKQGLGPRRGRWKRNRQRDRDLRKRVQIIYQDPYESLNPKLSIYDIVAEPLLANRVTSTQAEAQAVVAKAVEDVGLRPASEYLFRFPHELSGGQRQRVGIATALVVDPDFIVADEPVSMLDASVRTEILALLLELKKRRNLTYLFITHDLGLAWIIADRIAVMYLGKIVETGSGPEIIQNPRHPYTKALISVVPSPNPSVHREKMILRGERPNPVDIPPGCRFHPRCPAAVGICGWDADEVAAELEKLFKEDAESIVGARSASKVEVAATFEVRIATGDPTGLEAYLRKRLPAVGLKRPALGAIRTMTAESGALRLVLHRPQEPELRQITSNVSVACHLVEPEPTAPAAPEPEAVAPAD